MSARNFWSASLRRPGFLGLLLACLTLALYSPTVRHEFVNYDDPDYVTANPPVQHGLTLATVRWALSSGHASNWHPLTWLSHALDWQLFGDRAGGHHAVNLLLHALNSLLLFLVLRQMTGAHWRSALVAALFAWHPVHVESVAWISERKDVLSTFFFLLTLGAYASYARLVSGPRPLPEPAPDRGSKHPTGAGPRPAAGRTGREAPAGPAAAHGALAAVQPVAQPAPGAAARHWLELNPTAALMLTLLLFALGLMSKPMLVTLPFLLLLLDYWPLQRLGSAPSPSAPSAKPGRAAPPAAALTDRAWRTAGWLVLEKTPFFLLSLISCVVTFKVQQKGGAVSVSLSLGERIANALVAYVRYLENLAWPTKLAVLYPHPGHWPLGRVLLSALVLVALSAAVVWLARRRPFLPVGWFWFLGSLVPVIGLVQVGVQSMADRYTYVPAIGLFIAGAWGAAELALRWRWPAPLLRGLAAVGLAGCAVLTVRQLGFWHDSEALFRHAVAVTENNYLAYNNLGYYLSNRGQAAEAIEFYRRSLEINPAYEDALNNLGYALAGQKKFQEALGYYDAALRVRPDHPEVHNNLGNALSELGRIEEAIHHYHIVLNQKPNHADAHNNLGIALAMQGKLAEAVPHFQAAIQLKPNYASAHSNLGNAYAAQHRLEDAIREYQQSLRLKPDEAQAHNNLGNVLVELNRLEEAIPHYLQALNLNADNPEAHCNLGLALQRQGKRDQAAHHFREALRLKPNYEAARRLLTAP